MTDPRSPSDDDLVLAALDGNANSDASASVSSSLRAEIDGLRAVRALLDDDAAWGERSGVDAPPPHLLDAIVRAEVAARSDVVRQAMSAASAPSAPSAPSVWQRLSSWLVGGGVLVGAAAAMLIVVQREPALQAETSAAPTMPPADSAPAESPAPPPPPPPAAAPAAITATPTIADGAALGFASGDKLEAKEEAPHRAKDAIAEGRVAETAGSGPAVAEEARKGAKADLSGAASRSAVAMEAPAPAKPAMADAEDDAIAQPRAEPATSTAPMAPAVQAPSPPPPAEVSGNDVRRLFRERMAEKKSEASAPKAKKAPSSDSLARDRQIQEANSTLLTAERELAQGRFGSALDLAMRAEAIAGGALGLAPVATQARALRGLGRPADAARLGNRLMSADAADPQLMAGVVAAAASAFDVGDRVLCRRLSQVALKNGSDERLRDEARRLLKLVAQPQANEAADAGTSAPARP